MRLHNLLFVLVLLVVLVFMVADRDNLMRNQPMTVPFLGGFVGPLRLVGFVAILGVAALFMLAASLQGLQSNASSAGYLKRIEDLRKSLDREEASRFEALQKSLDAHAGRLLEKLEGANATQNAAPSAAAGGVDAEHVARLLAGRIDVVRDELAADIAALEDSILRAVASGDAAMIAQDRARNPKS